MSVLRDPFQLRTYEDRESVGRALRALADGFAAGRLTLAAGEKEVRLEPQGRLVLDVKAVRRGRLNRVSLRVSWREPGNGPVVAAALNIRAGDA